MRQPSINNGLTFKALVFTKANAVHGWPSTRQKKQKKDICSKSSRVSRSGVVERILKPGAATSHSRNARLIYRSLSFPFVLFKTG